MFQFLTRQSGRGWGSGYDQNRPLMQLMGLVLGDGCFYIGLGGSQRRDLCRRVLLFRGGALLCRGSDARLGVVRCVLVGDEWGRGFLQAEDSMLKKT